MEFTEQSGALTQWLLTPPAARQMWAKQIQLQSLIMVEGQTDLSRLAVLVERRIAHPPGGRARGGAVGCSVPAGFHGDAFPSNFPRTRIWLC